jgi:hypothetical protein
VGEAVLGLCVVGLAWSWDPANPLWITCATGLATGIGERAWQALRYELMRRSLKKLAHDRRWQDHVAFRDWQHAYEIELRLKRNAQRMMRTGRN